MEQDLIIIAGKFKEIKTDLENPPTVDQVKRIQSLSDLLISAYSEQFSGAVDRDFLDGYQDLIRSANKAWELGYSCEFDSSNIILYKNDIEQARDSFLSPVQLLYFIQSNPNENESVGLVKELFLSNEVIFSLLNFSIIYLKAAKK